MLGSPNPDPLTHSPGHAVGAIELGKGLQHTAVLGACHVRLDDGLCRVDGICRGEMGTSESKHACLDCGRPWGRVLLESTKGPWPRRAAGWGSCISAQTAFNMRPARVATLAMTPATQELRTADAKKLSSHPF
eukprot:scaffold41152_cov65-Phaeocystis_antarctica.AAC.8